MSTLAELNTTLGVVATNTEKTGKAIDALTNYFKGGTGDKLEKEREKKTSGGLMSMFTSSSKSKTTSGKGKGFSLGAMIPAFTLAGIGSGLLKALPPLVIATLADEIVNKFIDPNNNLTPEAKDLMIGGIELGGIAALFGKRFIPLGVALGALNAGLDDDVKSRSITVASDAINRISRLLFGAAPGTPGAQGPGGMEPGDGLLGQGGFFNTFATGLDGIADLLEGDFKGFNENLMESLSVIGGVMVLMSPLSPFRLFLGSLAGAGKKGFFMKAISALGKAVIGGAAINSVLNSPLFDGFREDPVGDDETSTEPATPDSVSMLAQLLGGYVLFQAGQWVIVKGGKAVWKGTAAAAKTAYAAAYQKMTGKTLPSPDTKANPKPTGTNPKSLSDAARKTMNPSNVKDMEKLRALATEQRYTIDKTGALKSGGKYVSNEEAEKFAKLAQKKLGKSFGITAGAKLAGKFALRFVPFVGWVMLASDAVALANYVAGEEDMASDTGARDMSKINELLNEKTMGAQYPGLDNTLISMLNEFEKNHPEMYNKFYGSTGVASIIRKRGYTGPPPSQVTPSDETSYVPSSTTGQNTNVNVGQIGSNTSVSNVSPLALMDIGTGDKWNANSRGLHSTSMLS